MTKSPNSIWNHLVCIVEKSMNILLYFCSLPRMYKYLPKSGLNTVGKIQPEFSDHGLRTHNKDRNQIRIWKFGTMWQTKLYLKIWAWECRRFPHWASVVRDSDGIMLILPAECRQLGKLSRMILIDQQCIIMCNH